MKYNFLLISLAIATPVPESSEDNSLLKIRIGSGGSNSGVLSSLKDKKSAKPAKSETVKSSDSSKPLLSQDRFTRGRRHRDYDDVSHFGSSRSRFDADNFDEEGRYDWEDSDREHRSERDAFRDGQECRFFASFENDNQCEPGFGLSPDGNREAEGSYGYKSDEGTGGNRDSKRVYRRNYRYRAHRS